MSHAFNQLLEAALGLPDEEQVRLAEALNAAIDGRDSRPFDDEWLAEIQRRSAEYDAGGVPTSTWAEVKSRLRWGSGSPDV